MRRPSSHRVMRTAPLVYLATILLLVAFGITDIYRIAVAAKAVVAQSQQTTPASQVSSQPEPAASPAGNRSYIVKRTTQGSQVQVNVSAAPISGDAPAKAPAPDGLKENLDNLKWILTLILAAAGLFTVVQGIAAGFSAQNFQKQSEDAIKRLEKEADRTLADVQRQSNETFERFDEEFQSTSNNAMQHLNDQYQTALGSLERESKASLNGLKNLETEVRNFYPLFEKDRLHAFTGLRDNISKFSLVKNLADGFDQRRRFYERIPLSERQQILAVDRALAYEIAGQNDPPELFAEQTRQLAQFYWSKFIYERAVGFAAWSDLERAEHLLELGLDKSPKDEQFRFWNALGNVRLERHKARVATGKPLAGALGSPADDPDLIDARIAFSRSIDLHPDQLRAYHNLALIDAYYSYATDASVLASNLRKAAELLEQGLAHRNWETQPVPEFRCGTLYNLACIHARLALLEPSQRDTEVEIFLRYLREAAELGFVPQEDVENDYEKETGDIYPVLQTGSTKAPESGSTVPQIFTEELRRKILHLKEELYKNAPEQD